MRPSLITRGVPLVPLALLLACGTAQEPTSFAIESHRAMLVSPGTWSAPINLGAPVNSPTANDQGPALSPDGLSLYFCSNRPPSGGNDLWVSRRASEHDPWGPPVNLGSGVNSSSGDCGPSLSLDSRLLFFTSNRTPSAGANDIYMTSRTDPADDLSWSAPVSLGPEINTTATELSPFITKFRGDCPGDEGDEDDDGDDGEAEGCVAQLYFERGATNVATDIYVVTIDRNATVLGPAVPVAEVNSSDADGRPTVRLDGREMLLHSNRDGRGGNFDLFVSTRHNRHQPWSTPVPVEELNAPIHEIHPYLSKNGLTVLFVRGTGLANDIWMAQRTSRKD